MPIPALQDMLNKYHWIPPALWGIIIMILSLLPGGPGNMQMFGIPHFDKVGHFGMYAIWTFFISRSIRTSSEYSSSHIFFLSFIIGTVIGVALEFCQELMTERRSFEIADMIANAVGSLVGAIMAGAFKSR